MDDFPYLIVLFLFTAVAAFLYAGKTKRNAEQAFNRQNGDRPQPLGQSHG